MEGMDCGFLGCTTSTLSWENIRWKEAPKSPISSAGFCGLKDGSWSSLSGHYRPRKEDRRGSSRGEMRTGSFLSASGSCKSLCSWESWTAREILPQNDSILFPAIPDGGDSAKLVHLEPWRDAPFTLSAFTFSMCINLCSNGLEEVDVIKLYHYVREDGK